MSRSFSASLRDQLLRILATDWMTVREICERLDAYQPTYVRTALNQLHSEGLCARRTEPHAKPQMVLNLYRVNAST